ncbi:MAG: UbiA family prenyltransferase [Gemmatales bacterium]|nr:UbiA family prenyltransferase [Gemmatales bacterium]MDW7994646.1 UbiA family prenyltransferase [Gemmatales bacterium]
MLALKLKGILELCRIANLPTAWADILCGWLVAGSVLGWPTDKTGSGLLLAWLLVATSGLYLSGMVWNDVFDVEEDQRERPHRPIPSGRVSRGLAMVLAGMLMAMGWLAGAVVSWKTNNAIAVALVSGLVACILIYDGWTKRLPWGVLWLSACRFGNVVLGASPWVTEALVPVMSVAAVNAFYVLGLAVVARPEVRQDGGVRRQLWFGGVLVLGAIGGAFLVAWLAQQGHFGHLVWGTSYGPEARWAVMCLAGAWAMTVTAALLWTIRRAEPRAMQSTVRRLLQGIIVLDAFLAGAFAGPIALALLLLVPLTVFLARYSSPT